MGGKQKSKYTWLMAAIVLCLCFFSLSAWYLNYVKQTIRQDSKGNLAELSSHITQSLNGSIYNTKEVLGSLALEISRNSYSIDELKVFLTEQSEFWGFYDLSVIDCDGISHHPDGSKDTPWNRQLLADALNTQSTTYDFLVSGGEDCVIFYYPLPEEAQKSSGYLAVCATYAVHNWNLLMDINVFDGKAVTQILTRNGVAITRNGDSGKSYYNYLDNLKNAKFENGMTFKQVTQKMKNRESIHLTYYQDGVEYYFSCVPIDFSDWCLTFTVPANTVNSAGVQMTHSVLIIGFGLTMVFLILLVLFGISHARSQKRIWNAAYVDEVTGGSNKNKFELDALALIGRDSREYMLVYTNIDQFKLLNQRFGKEEADSILKGLYISLNQKLKESECIGRLSADHFALLMEKDGIEQRLRDIAAAQQRQTTAGGFVCSIRLSFGLCPVEPGIRELTPVIDRANLAMEMSSQAEHGFSVFNDVMMDQAARNRELTEQLQQKVIEKEFFICLQPKVDLLTGQVVGAEALARWNSSKFGFVSPGEFIPLAEKSGMVCQIDWFAFECVCQTLDKWIKEGQTPVPISFNLSKAQLANPDFLDKYRETIKRYEIPCEYLDFEFTESLLYENSGVLQKAVERIHAMGAKCSVDDFGFGYSSLGLLGQFEADTLKLDRSFFLEDAKPDSRNNRIVKSVIQIADSLGMKTVAEGIENQEFVEMLSQFGCDSIQGYYFSKPLPVEEFERFAKERQGRSHANE